MASSGTTRDTAAADVCEIVGEDVVARVLLERLQEDDVALNRRAVQRAEGIVEVVDLARRHPEIYTVGDHSDDRDHAVRAAVFDIALRLQISENQVRGLLCTAETAQELLPLMWAQARDGLVGMRFVETATAAVLRLRAPVGADIAAREYAAEAIALIDRACADWALKLSIGAFRRRVNTLVERLDPTSAEGKHARGMVDRRVILEEADDGMTWIMALVPTVKAVAIRRRLTSAAKHLQKDRREGRLRDQIRADLFCDWLCGVGTDNAVKTTVFVTVPVGLLTGVAPASGNPAASATVAQLVGHGPIDSASARQMFFDASAFRRVITDPVRGVILDMDRRTYRPTKAQRDWLVLQHGTCARDGCTRLALDADLDHERAWAHGGATDIGNLRPLCAADHVRNHRTRLIYRSRPDRTVEVTTPTGHRTTDPPPF
ncbi:HNH endonuclease signature motif containing protein [Microbacterium panaciterrae]|uniref:HNH endonuclease signature motif containing protein n=1 Tax=Microbacterium panaciterrae TaxID=985759 RepID=A0ABP8P1L4_9MICO